MGGMQLKKDDTTKKGRRGDVTAKKGRRATRTGFGSIFYQVIGYPQV